MLHTDAGDLLEIKVEDELKDSVKRLGKRVFTFVSCNSRLLEGEAIAMRSCMR